MAKRLNQILIPHNQPHRHKQVGPGHADAGRRLSPEPLIILQLRRHPSKRLVFWDGYSLHRSKKEITHHDCMEIENVHYHHIILPVVSTINPHQPLVLPQHRPGHDVLQRQYGPIISSSIKTDVIRRQPYPHLPAT